MHFLQRVLYEQTVFEDAHATKLSRMPGYKSPRTLTAVWRFSPPTIGVRHGSQWSYWVTTWWS